MTNKKVKNTIDIEAVHFMLFFFTVIFATIGLLVDLISDQKFQLWWVILMSSLVLFVLSFVAKLAPKFSFFLMFIAITIIGYFSYIHIIVDYKILIPQLVLLIIYFLAMVSIVFINLFIIKNHQGTPKFDELLVPKKIGGSKISRKEKKSNRRGNSRSKLGNAIKSGKYRGWWTGY